MRVKVRVRAAYCPGLALKRDIVYILLISLSSRAANSSARGLSSLLIRVNDLEPHVFCLLCITTPFDAHSTDE